MTRSQPPTRPSHRRGSAALLVLLVLSFLTVIGFAMGDLCVIHLNLSRRYLAATRAQLLAQAAVQQFLVTFDKASAKLRESGLDLGRRDAAGLDLKDIYTSGDGLPNPGFDDMKGRASITFDAQADWCSTDNSLSEVSRASWLDRGTAARSIPPFAVELLVNVDMDGQVRHYRALVTRRWPFAVFTPRGAIALCGSPDAGSTVIEPTQVEGQVGTLGGGRSDGWKSATAQLTSTTTTVGGETFDEDGNRVTMPPGVKERTASERVLALNRLEPKCEVLIERSICVGPPLRYEKLQPVGADPSALGVTQLPGGSTGQPDIEIQDVAVAPDAKGVPVPGMQTASAVPLEQVDETQNVLEGDVHVPSSLRTLGANGSLESSDDLQIYPGNTHTGRVIAGFPNGLTDARNPADDAAFPLPDGYEPLPVPPLPETLRDSLGMMNGGAGEGMCDFGFLRGTLSLDPDQATVPPLQLGQHSRWVFAGNMGNRCVAIPRTPGSLPEGTVGPRARIGTGTATRVGGSTPTQPAEPEKYRLVETSGGLRLRNTVLYVGGNLDLSGGVAGKHTVSIEGSNSTLIVNGTLALSGGRLDSRDQGLVILANDIVMRAHGDYRGLIIAKNSLTILSDAAVPSPPPTTATPSPSGSGTDKTLTIRGGIICGNKKKGNIILRSVHVIYDPAYMKAVHAYGDAICSAWKEIR